MAIGTVSYYFIDVRMFSPQLVPRQVGSMPQNLAVLIRASHTTVFSIGEQLSNTGTNVIHHVGELLYPIPPERVFIYGE